MMRDPKDHFNVYSTSLDLSYDVFKNLVFPFHSSREMLHET